MKNNRKVLHRFFVMLQWRYNEKFAKNLQWKKEKK